MYRVGKTLTMNVEKTAQTFTAHNASPCILSLTPGPIGLTWPLSITIVRLGGRGEGSLGGFRLSVGQVSGAFDPLSSPHTSLAFLFLSQELLPFSSRRPLIR